MLGVQTTEKMLQEIINEVDEDGNVPNLGVKGLKRTCAQIKVLVS